MNIYKFDLRWWGIGIFIVALVVRLVWGLSQLERGFLFVSEGDYNLYQIGAEHFRAYGNFDNSLFLVRPPLFPLIVAALNDNHTLIIVMNAFLGALIAPLLMLIACQLGFSYRVIILAGILIALDPLHIPYTAFLGPEALSFVTALAMFSALLALYHAEGGRIAWFWGVIAAIMLLVSAYARPSIYLIWTGLSVWLLFIRPHYWYAILTFAILSFAGIQVWSQHNERVFNNATFSSIGAYTMTYYRAAAILNQANPDMPIADVYIEIGQRVEERLGNDPSLVDASTQHGYLAASPEVEAALSATSFDIFRAHPEWYIATLGLGIIRYFNLLPSFPPFANLTNPALYPPIIYNWLILGSATMGLFLCFARKKLLAFWGLILFCGYFSVGTLVVKSAGLTARERSVIIPLIVLLAAYGIVELYRMWQARHPADNKM